MKTRPSDQSDAERAVMAYKARLAIAVMRFILLKGLNQRYVFPGDVPEDIVDPEHRQGVVSNAWGCLDALEIIEKLPLNFNDPTREIFAGAPLEDLTDYFLLLGVFGLVSFAMGMMLFGALVED